MLTEMPIFIHAWWRSGSTYIWSKLRQGESCRCYFEPLNEGITDLKLPMIGASPEIDAGRGLRHPRLTRHYFAEYADLLRSGNLCYSRELAFDRYLLQPEQPDPQLRQYLATLIGSALAADRRPALCFCRSQMRSAWMKQNFDGIHIAQIRNPRDQWASFKSFQTQTRSNFPAKMTAIALKLRGLHPQAFVHIEAFERFAQQISKRSSLPVELVQEYFLRTFVNQRDCLDLFLMIWIASALQAIANCDFLLDIDRLSSDFAYRNSTSQWFDSIGCPVDFSDCSSPISTDPDPAFERMIDQAVRAVRSDASSLVVTRTDAVKKWLPSLFPLSRQILNSVLGIE
jgi:hypothetical protein